MYVKFTATCYTCVCFFIVHSQKIDLVYNIIFRFKKRRILGLLKKKDEVVLSLIQNMLSDYSIDILKMKKLTQKKKQ